jgi:uncharacterized protein with PIN domain
VRHSRAELEAALEGEAKQAIREYLDWAESAAAPSLTEIEDVVLKLRKRLGERMAQAVIDAQEAVQPVPGPACPECGREMHYKDKKGNTVESRVGTLGLQRGYYYCETCRSGIFPPG